MLAKLYTFSLLGIEAVPVEVDVSPAAMLKTILVGLPAAAVNESTHRVERAIVNLGFQRPHDRVVINLVPAELPRQAASFDLPMTLGVLAGSGQLASDRFEHYAVVGNCLWKVARGQEMAKQALVIAAAGAHNLLMLGPPGSGKTEYIPQHPTLDPAAHPWSDILFRRGSYPRTNPAPRTGNAAPRAELLFRAEPVRRAVREARHTLPHRPSKAAGNDEEGPHAVKRPTGVEGLSLRPARAGD